MAHRNFTLTLTNSYVNLYTAMLAVTGAVPTDGILPDRVSFLSIAAAAANSTSPVLISDANNANSTGRELLPGVPYVVTSSRNSICLRDYYVKGNTLVVGVDIESI